MKNIQINQTTYHKFTLRNSEIATAKGLMLRKQNNTIFINK